MGQALDALIAGESYSDFLADQVFQQVSASGPPHSALACRASGAASSHAVALALTARGCSGGAPVAPQRPPSRSRPAPIAVMRAVLAPRAWVTRMAGRRRLPEPLTSEPRLHVCLEAVASLKARHYYCVNMPARSMAKTPDRHMCMQDITRNMLFVSTKVGFVDNTITGKLLKVDAWAIMHA